MVCLGNLWMVCLGNLWLSKRWSRHRKDGVPRKTCGSVRWSMRRKDGVPRKLMAQ